MIKIEPIAAFSDNYIWCLYDQERREAAVVDPGDAAPVLEYLQKHQLTLTTILITHHHFDHTGGIADLLAAHGSNLPVYGPYSDNIAQITHPLDATSSFELFNLHFECLTIPGHTLDHIALFCPDNAGTPLLFCGDTLFAGGCGRVFEGNPAMMLKSLEKLASLPASTLVYCAHEYTLSNLAFAQAVEPDNEQLLQRLQSDSDKRQQALPTIPSTLALELATNPFLRCQQPSVIRSASHHSEQACDDPVAVFAAIRGWKDSF
ncbi:hydroxyacylglutathione hydrolase [Oceanicoccus sp. KOV_DT_Chl]|uniref:hydroxyacylglutathione hydrolase n=1 Tax=Oceanicoccus sp. KOV_DT_Chl TaxID=1904639 RepID=UPI000C7E6B88|nr:hydroxyacylglutathione hydrolase [Oceanicoccus sp. KOV_DT_Chl]